MIGDDDWATFFDPDELGVAVMLHVPGEPGPRQTGGMWSQPLSRDNLRRAYTGGRGLRALPDASPLQIATRDLPEGWRDVRVTAAGVDYAISDVNPLGRLRSELVLTPWQKRSNENGSWLRP